LPLATKKSSRPEKPAKPNATKQRPLISHHPNFFQLTLNQYSKSMRKFEQAVEEIKKEQQSKKPE
jgi:hypothetical protein